jgi:hypothetical protein
MKGRTWWARKDLSVEEGLFNTETLKAYHLGLARGLDTAARMCEDFSHTRQMAILIRAAGTADVDPETGKPPCEHKKPDDPGESGEHRMRCTNCGKEYWGVPF